MLAADTCFVRVLVVGCGLCDFFVLFVFCVFTPTLLCWLCVRYLGRMVDALAC